MIKQIFRIALFFLFAFIATDVAYASGEYEVSNYTVNVKVNGNNVVDVVEIISVEFTGECEFISQSIPLKGVFQIEENGSFREVQYSATISDVAVIGSDFEISKDGNNVNLKIYPKEDDATQTFNVFYTLDFGDDGIGELDSFYFNLIPSDFDALIKTAIFHIEMPKEFDASKLNVYSIVNNKIDVEYALDDNTIYFALGEIKPGGNIVVETVLPEGYFLDTNTQYNWYPVYYVGTILSLILVIYLFVIFGKDDKISPKYEFYPPENLSPVEVGYIVDGHISSKDVISLIIFWADKGFVNLDARTEGEIMISKIKSLPKESEDYEKKLFNELFRHRSLKKATFIDLTMERKTYSQFFKEALEDDETKIDANLISSKDFKFAIYPNVGNIAKRIKRKYAKDKKIRLFTRISKFIQILVLMIFSLPIFLGSLLINLQDVLYTETNLVVMKSLLLTGGIVAIFLITNRWTIIWNSTMNKYKYGRSVLIALFMLAGIYLSLRMLWLNDNGNLMLALVAILSTYIMGALALIMDKRTYRSNVLLSKILGLKMFVNDASNAQITDLVSKNPEYYFDLLPYVYVLGISDVWAKKFESMHIKRPKWLTTPKNAPYIDGEYLVKILQRGFNPVQSD